jgi:hypothetical protein
MNSSSPSDVRSFTVVIWYPACEGHGGGHVVEVLARGRKLAAELTLTRYPGAVSAKCGRSRAVAP